MLALYGALTLRTGKIRVRIRPHGHRSGSSWEEKVPPIQKIIPLPPAWSGQFQFLALPVVPASVLFLGNFRGEEVELEAVEVPPYIDGAFGDGFVVLLGEDETLHRLRLIPEFGLCLEVTLHWLPLPVVWKVAFAKLGSKGIFVLSDGAAVAFTPSDRMDSLGWEIRTVQGEGVESIHGIAPGPDGVILYGEGERPFVWVPF